MLFRSLAAAVLLTLGACAESTTPVPSGAVYLDEDYYMVPASSYSAGCELYSPWSSARAVTAATYYRKPDGSFTLYRSDIHCGG